MMLRTSTGVLGFLAALGAFFWFACGGHRTPEPQPPLADLTAHSLDSFRGSFNAASDEVRIILLLSPT